MLFQLLELEFWSSVLKPNEFEFDFRRNANDLPGMVVMCAESVGDNFVQCFITIVFMCDTIKYFYCL